MSFQKVRMHDLYCEFVELESKGKLNKSYEFEKQHWVYVHDYLTKLQSTSSRRCWHNLIQVAIINIHTLQSQEEIRYRYYPNLVVLKLVGLELLQGVLNLAGLKYLRSLELWNIYILDRLDGLEDLNNLTIIRCCNTCTYEC